MKWYITSRTIHMKNNERNIMKRILEQYPYRNIVNKLIKKLNTEKIVLNNDELSTLHVILVANLDSLNESDRGFIDGFLCNIA